ncbi:hypothetical protein BE04_27790 [Sorangium cellulosum]|uniref:Uncharacterized protein n=2 Tax=Sorangium cellulosum TaxID=56 RepID=A0A150PP66_SORCE|nr:hypothetical protein [Sorangium cellulosum]AGP38269.1 hypothetical protein SCE1572_29600 [Sorangium cellulosum So0157-2]KYF57495.1 hypothetical protein BE04_27790 [Sorangium cellulosum]
MLKRGAPAFQEHVHWEETIAQLVTQGRLAPGQGGLLEEAGDLRFAQRGALRLVDGAGDAVIGA